MRRRIISRKITAGLMCGFLILANLGINTIPVLASEGLPAGIYTATKDEHPRKDNALTDVSSEMLKPGYWYDKTNIDSDKLLMTPAEIAKLNEQIACEPGTNVRKLENISPSFNGISLVSQLSNLEIPDYPLYVDGKLLDNTEYFSALSSFIRESESALAEANTLYAVTSNRADMVAYPTDDKMGYSAGDTDNEMQASALNVNEPFAVRVVCTTDKGTFCYGYSNNCQGWVNAKNLAICSSKEEWLDSWKLGAGDKNILVVTDSQINLDCEASETVALDFGSILKLVPDSEIPAELAGQKEANYIVYFPGRAADGSYVKRIALINKTLGVHKGFLDLTEKNLLDVAFSCFGDPYGWGGMDGNMDCSLYTRYIYRCFGFELPRNTTWQENVPEKVIRFGDADSTTRERLLDNISSGGLLYFLGHTMMYIGRTPQKQYVISDLGSVYDETGKTLIAADAVTVNSLMVRRGNGKTWLDCLTSVLDLTSKTLYEVSSGSNQSFEKEKCRGLSFEIGISLDAFKDKGSLLIDKTLLNTDLYEVKAGTKPESSIISINTAYVNDLAIGQHTIEALLNDKIYSTNFQLTAVDTSKPVTMDQSIVDTASADILEAIKKAEATDSKAAPVKIDMTNKDGSKSTVVSNEIIELIKGSDLQVELDMGDYSWVIDGKSVSSIKPSEINLEVIMDTNNIPETSIKAISEGKPVRQLSLSHNGDFGFTASLKINMGSKYSGLYGNLYWYDDNNKLSFISSGLIDQEGLTKLKFTHASDYIILIGDNMDPELQLAETEEVPPTSDRSAPYIPAIFMILAAATLVLQRKRFQ